MMSQTLGQKIKHARRKAELSQAQLAVKMGLEADAIGAISKWETDEREPKLRNISRLADALGVRMGWLINGK